MYFLMSYVVVFALDSTSHIDPSSGLFVMIVGAFGIIAHTGQTLMTFFAGMIALYVAYKARKKIKALSSK